MKRLLSILAVLTLGACASYNGAGLKPGVAQTDDVIRVMGQPAMRWQDPDGSVQLAYPRGPWATQTYMAYVGPDGKLKRIENVLDQAGFARIQRGQTKDQVLRILGPSYPGWTEYFKARDELVWEWRYCNEWSQAARFDVLFDGTTGQVRSTMSRPEFCGKGNCPCGR